MTIVFISICSVVIITYIWAGYQVISHGAFKHPISDIPIASLRDRARLTLDRYAALKDEYDTPFKPMKDDL